jgi:hypothetical protein
MACSCCRHDGHSTYIRSSIARGVVSVSFGRSTSSVRVAALNVIREDGRRRVSLADIWWAASLPMDPARLRFDLVGDDGFDTSLKRGEPLTGDALIHGFVDVDTRDVSWTTNVPCFYRVKGMVALSARLHLRAMVSAT